MRTCYLHLGMPKTGSSSIQEAFYNYSSATLAYAPLREKSHGLPLSAVFAENPTTFREFRDLELGPKQVAQKVALWREQIDASCALPQSVIFSGEGIIDKLKPAEFAKLVETMRSRFDRVIAIAYVRPLASLAASQFQQRVRTGLGALMLPAPDYRRRFQPMLDAIGRENCILVRFDRADLFGGEIVADFAHRLNLAKAPKSDVATNESLSSEVLGVLFAFNRFTGPLLRPKERTRIRRELENLLREAGTTKFGLSPELVREHVKKHAEDVEWIERVCGFDLTGEAKPVPHPTSNETDLLDIAAEFAARQPNVRRKQAP